MLTMVFLLITGLLLVTELLHLIQEMSSRVPNDQVESNDQLIRVGDAFVNRRNIFSRHILAFLLGCCWCLTFYLSFSYAFDESPRGMDEPNYAPVMFFAMGSLMMIMGVVWKAFRVRPGANSVIFVVGLYFFSSAINHWMFVDDIEKVGMTHIPSLKEAGLTTNLDDVDCSGYALVKQADGVVHWRCPSMFMFGDPFSKYPLIGLFDYTSGTSSALSEAIGELMHQAKRAPSAE